MTILPAKFLAHADINGKKVTFFTPPHDEPDFPWVDVEELARAFLPKAASKRMLAHAHDFDKSNRPIATVKNGDRIATIFCHAMAQGLCGAIDVWAGRATEDEEGPAHIAYSLAAGQIMHDHWPLPLPDLMKAFNNQGGPYMRTVREA